MDRPGLAKEPSVTRWLASTTAGTRNCSWASTSLSITYVWSFLPVACAAVAFPLLCSLQCLWSFWLLAHYFAVESSLLLSAALSVRERAQKEEPRSQSVARVEMSVDEKATCFHSRHPEVRARDHLPSCWVDKHHRKETRVSVHLQDLSRAEIQQLTNGTQRAPQPPRGSKTSAGRLVDQARRAKATQLPRPLLKPVTHSRESRL